VEVPGWVGEAVFYQIFPDRFAPSPRVPKPGPMEPWEAPPTLHGFKGGDLLGIAERIDELVDLGVGALYLTPIFTSASNHRYHAYDYLSVDPLLGGDNALRELLDTAHARGIRVVLDGVFNHCGRGFWQFHHVLEQGAASPYRDWFLLDEAVREGRAGLNAYPDRSGVDMRVGHPLGYRAWWGLPALPKFNVAHPPVREYLLSVADHWLRFGIDGWRLDVPAEIEDETFWQEFRHRCRAVNPDCYLVGEIWDEAPEWLAGDRFDALMNYPLGAAILGYVGGDSLDMGIVARHDTYARTIRHLDAPAFGARLDRLMSNYDPAVVASQLNLIGSHDTPRALTVLSGDRVAVRQAITLQMTLPGAPCIYYGDELGMEGGLDPDCRRSYPADPGAGDRELRSFVRSLVAARREHVALRRGEVSTAAVGERSIAIGREADGFRALVALNPGPGTERLSLARPADERLRPIEVPGLAAATVEPPPGDAVGDGVRTLVLPPRSGAIYLAT
jgi:neopullulanase